MTFKDEFRKKLVSQIEHYRTNLTMEHNNKDWQNVNNARLNLLLDVLNLLEET